MKRLLPITLAALLTLGGLTLFAAPATAREYHPRPAHGWVRVHPREGWRYAAKREAHVRHLDHFRAPRYAAHRR